MGDRDATFVDFKDLPPRERYKLLVASVVPRPIAFVTTIGLDGIVNAAPFSFFNALLDDPPIVGIGVAMVEMGRTKDTAENIRYTGEFVVNLVDEALAPQMNECAVDVPKEVDEIAEAGLTPLPSRKISPPRIAQSPISLECKRHTALEIGKGRSIILGEVQAMHFRPDLFDAEKNYVDAASAGLIGRMHALDYYTRTTDLVRISRSQRVTKEQHIRKAY